ncbi:MAG: NAD(P)/FAD-dependent oxidoreductase [Fimbriimonadaceae bacterium]
MATISDGNSTLVVYGIPHSPESYALRDFLQRSMVDYRFIDLTSDEVCFNQLGIPTLDEANLPIVDLPCGARIDRPTPLALAEHMGWFARPQWGVYDLAIYGAGPAGLSAAVYGASEGLRTVLIEKFAVGGQAGTTSLIENYLGFPDGLAGAELAKRAKEQAVKFGAELLLMYEGVEARVEDGKMMGRIDKDTWIESRATLCATGVEYRKLGLENEEKFLGRGLYYGAGMSEAEMCRGADVYVIGGGNSAGQAVVHFGQTAKQVHMLVRGPDLSATLSDYLVQRIKLNPEFEVHYQTAVTGLRGDRRLEEIELTNRGNGDKKWVECNYLFVCIGGAPQTEWAAPHPILRDEAGYINTWPDLSCDPRFEDTWNLERLPLYLESSMPGVFAAGDVRHNSIKRVASAVGEGAMAVAMIHRYLAEAA